jgi:hypothetical protein
VSVDISAVVFDTNVGIEEAPFLELSAANSTARLSTGYNPVVT